MMGHRHITTTERYLHFMRPTQTARRSSRSCGATAAAGIVAHPRPRRPTWCRCAASPDAPIAGLCRGAGQAARPPFCAGKSPELGRVWGESAFFGVSGELPVSPKSAVLQAILIRGDDRNRTGVDGFAGRCVATPPRRRGCPTSVSGGGEHRARPRPVWSPRVVAVCRRRQRA